MLVRHHDKFERKEILRLGLRELFGLVDFAPYLIQILVNHRLNLIEGDAVVVVAQHEEQFLGGLLVEKLQVDLEDDFKQSII